MKELTVAIYVDSQHLFFAARAYGDRQGAGHMFDYEGVLNVILETVRRKYPNRTVRFVRQRVYIATRNRAQGFVNALTRFGYTVREHILRNNEEAFDWDSQIIVDVVADNLVPTKPIPIGHAPELAPGDTGEVVVLVSGDGDFAPLKQLLPEMLVFGFPDSTSSKLPNVTFLDERVLYHG